MSSVAVARSFSRHAHSYADTALVQAEIATHLLSGIAADNWQGVCADLGAGVGQQCLALQQRFQQAKIVAYDISAAMCALARQTARFADVRQADILCNPPLADASIRFLFSSCVLQWSADLTQTLQDWCRALEPAGEVAIACIAAGSLREVDVAWRSVGRASPVNAMPSVAAIEAAVQQQPWHVLSIEQRQHRQYFTSAQALVHSIHAVGAGCAAGRPSLGLLTPKRWRQCLAALPRCAKTGRVYLTYEVVYVRCRQQGS